MIGAAATSTWLDPVVIGIILASAALGFFRGLIRSAAGLGGLILAALFAGRFAALIDPALDDAHIKHPPIGGAVAFMIAFVAIVVAVELAANVLRIVSRLFFMGWADRLGGALFGLVRGVLVAMVLLAGFAMFNSSQFNGAMRQASVAVWLWKTMPVLAAMLPAGMQQSTIRLAKQQAPFLGEPSPTP